MEGKTAGTVAFVISEIIVVLGALAIFISSFLGIDTGITAGHVFTLQGVVFGGVWGGVATKNFKKAVE